MLPASRGCKSRLELPQSLRQRSISGAPSLAVVRLEAPVSQQNAHAKGSSDNPTPRSAYAAYYHNDGLGHNPLLFSIMRHGPSSLSARHRPPWPRITALQRTPPLSLLFPVQPCLARYIAFPVFHMRTE